MKGPPAAFLLLTLQWLTPTALALPPQPIEERSAVAEPAKCAPNEFKFLGLGVCVPKVRAGDICARSVECRSGFCDTSPSPPKAKGPFEAEIAKLRGSGSKSLESTSKGPGKIKFGKCAKQCSDKSPCPKGSTCRDSACYRGNQALTAKCYGNEDCESKNCIAQSCQPPNAKLVGEACEEKDNCEVGSMCWKGSCSTRGFNYKDGTLGGSCYDAKHNVQCLDAAYCDTAAGYTCQPKKGKDWACGTNNVLDGLLAGSQCVSGRCAEGFCGPSHVGTAGEPCSQNEKVCVGNFECKASLYDGVNGPAKMCQWPENPDVGEPCKHGGDCPGPDTRCYRGGDSAITGTCQRTYTIGGKACKTEDECGGIGRTRVWTNFGAYDGVDGGWGIRQREDGFICSDGKCQDVHREFSDTKEIKED